MTSAAFTSDRLVSHGCALLLLCASITACTKRPAVMLEGDDKVVAVVNESTITNYDVERTARDTLGETGAQLTGEPRKKLVQSLVESRAMAQAAEQSMTPRELAAVEKRTAAYREQLLVKHYLAKNAPAASVSDDQIRAYYERNRARFGAVKVRSYELITSVGEPSPNQRNALINVLGPAAEQADWQAWVDKLKRGGHPLALRRGQSDESMLHPKLRQLLGQLSMGKTSPLTFVEGQPYLVRITHEREQPARPLAEVSAEIRTLLEPAAVRNSVRSASDEVLKQAQVAYR